MILSGDILEQFETASRPARATSVALGIFDGMHRAHRAVVEAAAGSASGLEPWVFTFAMGSSPAGKSGASYLISRDMKYRLMRACGIAHVYSPEFSELRGLSAAEFVDKILVEHLGAEAVACGYDFRCGQGASCDTEMFSRLCRERGIALTVVGEQDDGGEPISSTRIRRAVASGDMGEAARLAGYPFVIDTEVVGGNRLGRKHGLATINQPIASGFVRPLFGVYASAVYTGGRFWPAVTDVGVKPTVSRGADPAAETHLISYSGDLYGQRPPVFLLEFLRPEMCFGCEDELFAQISSDAEKSEALSRLWIEKESAAVSELFGF